MNSKERIKDIITAVAKEDPEAVKAAVHDVLTAKVSAKLDESKLPSTVTSKDGKVTITFDLADKSELEAKVCFKTTNEDEKSDLFDAHRDWMDREFHKRGFDMRDFAPKRENVAEDGWLCDYLEGSK